MDARDLIGKIRVLRNHACQDFLSLVLIDKWQEKLYNTIETYINDKKPWACKYKKAYKKMRVDGIDKYDTKLMDVTFIDYIIQYNKSLLKPIRQDTLDAFDRIKDDRDDTCHLNDNEDQNELCYQGLLFLKDLEKFVFAVDDENESIRDTERKAYLQKYSSDISALKQKLNSELFELMQPTEQRKRDLECILESQDPSRMWYLYSEKYLHEFKISGSDEDYIAFLTEAADAKVVEAVKIAARTYYEKKDYDKAEQYLSFLYDNYDDFNVDPTQMMDLAKIYLNDLCSKSGDGHAVIRKLIDKGYDVRLSDDGTRYELCFKNTNGHNYIIPIPPQKRTSKPLNPPVIKESYRKNGLTVGGVSGLPKMRLGRIHKKKDDDNNSKESQ